MVIERVVLLTKKNTIRYSDLQDSLTKGQLSLPNKNQLVIDLPERGISLEKIGHKVILEILDKFNWNKSETANFLKISRPRLRRIIEKAGLERNIQK